MKKLIFSIFILLTISHTMFGQIAPTVLVNNVNITTDKEYIFQTQGSGPFVVSFSFYSQDGTTTSIRLYESTDNGRSFHAYPDMPSISIADLANKASAFRDPWSCQATHLKVVITLESGKRINGFYLTYKPS